MFERTEGYSFMHDSTRGQEHRQTTLSEWTRAETNLGLEP